MSTPLFATTRGHWPRLLGLLAASYALCVAAFILYGWLSRASHWEGAMDGLFFSVFLVTVPWLLVFGPLTGAVYYARRNRPRWRRRIVLAPSVVVFFLILRPLLIAPPTTANRFRQLTNHALPASAQEVRMYDVGGGFDGVETTFLFRCAAGDTEELIRALGLRPSGDKGWPAYDDRPDATWPDPRRWEASAFYSKERRLFEPGPLPDDNLSYTLCTDAAHTQVYLNVSPH